MKVKVTKECSAAITKNEPIMTDPNGSYTGLPRDPYEKPVQDADDL